MVQSSFDFAPALISYSDFVLRGFRISASDTLITNDSNIEYNNVNLTENIIFLTSTVSSTQSNNARRTR